MALTDLLVAAFFVEFHKVDGFFSLKIGRRVVECQVAVFPDAQYAKVGPNS